MSVSGGGGGGEIAPVLSLICMSATAPPPTPRDAITERVGRLLQDSRRELAAYGIVDTPREPAFDSLAELAARVTGWPVALVSFFDGRRQWYKATVGLDIEEDDAASTFCLNIIAHGHSRLYVADARNDERFRDNAYVCGEPYIRAYIGIPIRESRTGITLGTLAVCNYEAGALDEGTFRTLAMIAEQIENLLELRREDYRRRVAEHRLATANRQLEAFARTVAHDLQAPLRHQSSFAGLLREQHADGLSDDARELIDRLARSADEADGLLRELLDYALIADAASGTREEFSVRPFLEEVFALAQCPEAFVCEAVSSLVRMTTPRVAVKHIALNLVTNAIRHHDREEGRVVIAIELEGRDYVLSVSDDGPGIPAEHLSTVFERREVPQGLSERLRRGIGTYIVTELTASLCGDVEVVRNREFGDDNDRSSNHVAGPRGTTVRVRWPAV